jgi:hypothetical protein
VLNFKGCALGVAAKKPGGKENQRQLFFASLKNVHYVGDEHAHIHTKIHYAHEVMNILI